MTIAIIPSEARIVVIRVAPPSVPDLSAKILDGRVEVQRVTAGLAITAWRGRTVEMANGGSERDGEFRRFCRIQLHGQRRALNRQNETRISFPILPVPAGEFEALQRKNDGFSAVSVGNAGEQSGSDGDGRSGGHEKTVVMLAGQDRNLSIVSGNDRSEVIGKLCDHQDSPEGNGGDHDA
ncbi:hypothetical protein [Sphingomonas sp. Leaf257]|jgi:hypothetical protein|uniref:hypothetical protein n=1 Tax=Sphingomonas sp. Leaf257 TaxID=1736309 RepID=UPI0006FF79F6|nr:hypothetical protein [Sphingomonas sp. Leaf257]KQO52681.1 hypothetical protein ASF14_05105 [Sphingomonas sp. Leaf257]